MKEDWRKQHLKWMNNYIQGRENSNQGWPFRLVQSNKWGSARICVGKYVSFTYIFQMYVNDMTGNLSYYINFVNDTKLMKVVKDENGFKELQNDMARYSWNQRWKLWKMSCVGNWEKESRP